MESIIKKLNKDNNICVVYECTVDYLLPVSVSIASLIKSSSNEYNYDIIILCYNISEDDEYIVANFFEAITNEKPNLSLRFYDPVEDLAYYIDKRLLHNNPIGYYRLMLPWILNDYDKVINLGADTILNCDIAELFMTELNDEFIGNTFIKEKRLINGKKNDAIVIDPDVMLMNLSLIKTQYKIQDLLFEDFDFLKERKVFTNIFENTLIKLDCLWDVVPSDAKDTDTINNAKIYHYSGPNKPWENPTSYCAEKWWRYARQSPHYEAIIRNAYYKEKDNRSFIRKLVDVILPKGTRRREFVKMVLRPGK